MNLNDLIHPEDRVTVQKDIEAAIREHRPYDCLYRLDTADNQVRAVWDRGWPQFSEDGSLMTLEGIITDARDQILFPEGAQQQVADLTRKLSALHDILETSATQAELPVKLKRSLRAALIAAQGNAGFIHLREKSGLSLRLVARQNMSDVVANKITSVSAEDGLVAWVARNKAPLVISDVNHDPRTVYLANQENLNVFVGVPIARGERVWGTLSIMGTEPHHFGEEEIAILASIGEEIGLVVENVRLRHRAERLLVVQERNRLARELHDSVTQSLYSVTLFAEAGRRKALEDNNDEVAGFFTQIGETGQQALKEMRLLIYRLRPPILAKEGLVRALQQRLNSVERRAGVQSKLMTEGEMNFSPAIEDALYQIALEALNNALKHAMASEIMVNLSLQDDDVVVIRIQDNGRGFDPAAAADSDGMGLVSMKERAENLGGVLMITSTLGQGSMIEAHLRNTKANPAKRADFDVEDLL